METCQTHSKCLFTSVHLFIHTYAVLLNFGSWHCKHLYYGLIISSKGKIHHVGVKKFCVPPLLPLLIIYGMPISHSPPLSFALSMISVSARNNWNQKRNAEKAAHERESSCEEKQPIMTKTQTFCYAHTACHLSCKNMHASFVSTFKVKKEEKFHSKIDRERETSGFIYLRAPADLKHSHPPNCNRIVMVNFWREQNLQKKLHSNEMIQNVWQTTHIQP